MFKKLLILGVLLLIFFFFIGGYFALPYHSSSESIIINKPIGKVWDVLDDTQRFSESRHEVDEFEFLENTKEGYKSWKEHTPFFGNIIYEIKEEKPRKKIAINMVESEFGLSGMWTFYLLEEGENTKVHLIESSKNEGLLMRSILNTLGRGANVTLLLKALKRETEKL